jgi:branched-chain amino acid transport system ATP-binding protein
VTHVIDKIAELKRALGLTVLMAEQNFQQAIRIADRGYVLVHGKIEFFASGEEELRNSDVVRRLYLGI